MALKPQEKLLTGETIHHLLLSSTSEVAELKAWYALLPTTTCARKADCCAMLPEATLVEALAALKRLQQTMPGTRRRVLEKIVAYFFSNPAQLTACPFLDDKQCAIYADRFFGCRAYGLWSLPHYARIAHQSRQTKKSIAKVWQNLGIRLPEKVIDFYLPYCRELKISSGAEPNDSDLIHIAERIDLLSNRMAPWHQTFSRLYYGDLSFLVTAIIYDIGTALRMKVDIVRAMVSAGDSNLLNEVLLNVWDVLAPLD